MQWPDTATKLISELEARIVELIAERKALNAYVSRVSEEARALRLRNADLQKKLKMAGEGRQ